jgi:hypothetical protein
MDRESGWPELPYEAWKETRDTLHMYVQIMGKVRAGLAPEEPNWGHAPLYLTARGLNTSPIPHPGGTFDIDVDLVDHVVSVRIADGRIERIRLEPRPVADFYAQLMGVLARAGLGVEISPAPSDVPDGIPFAEDDVHRSYEREWANRFWRALLSVDAVLKEHRARFLGKATPVQLWWGSFDLAYSRFSGPSADVEHAAGFWAGDERFPEAAFYAYTSPRPSGLETANVEPAGGFWNEELGEFVLRYDAARRSTDPRDTLLAFLESTYRAGRSPGGFDPPLERGPGPA